MRYLTLSEAVLIAEAVTNLDAETIPHVSRLELLDSALHAPMAGFGDEDFYPDFVDKAAVLAVRIARNHPLPDGNKRLAWAAMNMFCELNGKTIESTADDAVAIMLAVAAGEADEAAMADWLRERISA